MTAFTECRIRPSHNLKHQGISQLFQSVEFDSPKHWNITAFTEGGIRPY